MKLGQAKGIDLRQTLKRNHLDILFEDGNRWDEALQDFSPNNR